MAVMQNDTSRLRELLQSGVSPKQKSVDGATALHRAAEIGSILCAEILLEYEAQIDAPNLLH